MSAFPESGRSDGRNQGILKVRFRPEAALRTIAKAEFLTTLGFDMSSSCLGWAQCLDFRCAFDGISEVLPFDSDSQRVPERCSRTGII